VSWKLRVWITDEPLSPDAPDSTIFLDIDLKVSDRTLPELTDNVLDFVKRVGGAPL